jgi:NAD(P)-dependent dehydrogenase (short-subunit alcohol dehydrogenase family)
MLSPLYMQSPIYTRLCIEPACRSTARGRAFRRRSQKSPTCGINYTGAFYTTRQAAQPRFGNAKRSLRILRTAVLPTRGEQPTARRPPPRKLCR